MGDLQSDARDVNWRPFSYASGHNEGRPSVCNALSRMAKNGARFKQPMTCSNTSFGKLKNELIFNIFANFMEDVLEWHRRIRSNKPSKLNSITHGMQIQIVIHNEDWRVIHGN